MENLETKSLNLCPFIYLEAIYLTKEVTTSSQSLNNLYKNN